MKELKPGAKIRVEFNAEIIGLADPSNPYWYTVRFPDGTIDTVSLARIHAVVDHTRAVMDSHDCSIQVFSPRLSAEGALDLLLWLETHRHEFEQATIPPPMQEGSGYAPNGSNYHEVSAGFRHSQCPRV